MSYLFRYLTLAGGVLCLHVRPCASDEEAFKVATAAPHGYDRLEIRRGDTVIWSGPPMASPG